MAIPNSSYNRYLYEQLALCVSVAPVSSLDIDAVLSKPGSCGVADCTDHSTHLNSVIFYPLCHPASQYRAVYNLELKHFTLLCGVCHKLVVRVKVDDLQEPEPEPGPEPGLVSAINTPNDVPHDAPDTPLLLPPLPTHAPENVEEAPRLGLSTDVREAYREGFAWAAYRGRYIEDCPRLYADVMQRAWKTGYKEACEWMENRARAKGRTE